jgi:D-Tyr-tRNAtyr deacylase
LAQRVVRVETGRFGAHISVALVNEGPVTLMVEVERAAQAL